MVIGLVDTGGGGGEVAGLGLDGADSSVLQPATITSENTRLERSDHALIPSLILTDALLVEK